MSCHTSRHPNGNVKKVGKIVEIFFFRLKFYKIFFSMLSSIKSIVK